MEDNNQRNLDNLEQEIRDAEQAAPVPPYTEEQPAAAPETEQASAAPETERASAAPEMGQPAAAPETEQASAAPEMGQPAAAPETEQSARAPQQKPVQDYYADGTPVRPEGHGTGGSQEPPLKQYQFGSEWQRRQIAPQPYGGRDPKKSGKGGVVAAIAHNLFLFFGAEIRPNGVIQL